MNKKEWCAANKDKVREQRIRYKMRHPMRHRIEHVYKGTLYRSMKRRAKIKGWELDFDRQQFIELLAMSGFHEIFAQWQQSGYLRKLAPTVDRIDEKGKYVLKNIQILTLEQNQKKYHSWVREIKNN